MNLSVSMRWVLSASLVMAAALGIGRFAYTPLLPLMVTELGWSFGVAGDVASANFLGYMVGALLAPKIALSPQVRAWVALSFMASVLTTYLGAEVSSYLQWLTIRFFSGIASAFCLVVMTTNLIHVLSEQGTERLGNVHFAGVGIGIIICMAAVYQSGDTGEQWARLGMLAALLMALAWALVASQPFQSVTPAPDQSDAPSSNPQLTRLIIGYGFFGYGYVVAATFVVAMAERIEVVGFDARTVWLVVGLALVPSVYCWQWAANRFGLSNALRVAYLVECVGVLMAGVSSSVFALVVACVFLGGTFGAITALGISAARAVAGHQVAHAVSAMTVAFALGQLIGPAVAGRMADMFGDFVWSSVIAATLLACAAMLVGKPHKETIEPAS